MKNKFTAMLALFFTVVVVFSPLLLIQIYENENERVYPKFVPMDSYKLDIELKKNKMSPEIRSYDVKEITLSSQIFNHELNSKTYGKVYAQFSTKLQIYKSKLLNHELDLGRLKSQLFKTTIWSIKESGSYLKNNSMINKIPILPDEPYAAGVESSIIPLLFFTIAYSLIKILKFFS